MYKTFFKLFQRLARPLRFGIVGLSGIVVNSAILWVLVRELHLAVTLGSMVATEAAILSNFLLNDRWTFRGARERSFIQRMVRFNGVALGGMAITAGILTVLTHYTHLHLLFANLLAVGAATGWNYIVNSRWTWRQAQGDGGQEVGDRGAVGVIDDSSSVVGRLSSVVVEEVTV
jgi:dolichol-phosphate mannosyltransferase